MQPLNDDFAFDQLPASKRREVQNAFSGIPRKETYAVGTRFYRFVTPKKGEQAPLLGNSVLDAEWWFGEAVRSQLSRAAHRQRTSLGNAARSRLAVTREFNREMEYLCRILVVSPVCGWVGRARWQQNGTETVLLPGGAEQVYFPSLSVAPTGLSSNVAKLDMWAYLDDAL